MQIILNDLYHKSVRELMDEGYQVTIALEPAIPDEKKEMPKLANDTIAKTVKINRSRTARKALKATGMKLYMNDVVVEAMPQGEGDEVEVHLFKVGSYITDNELEKEFDLRGLKPASPFALAAINEADPAFADDKSNATHWKDADGNWCYAIFERWFDGRRAVVSRNSYGWNDCCWFAGVRK